MCFPLRVSKLVRKSGVSRDQAVSELFKKKRQQQVGRKNNKGFKKPKTRR